MVELQAEVIRFRAGWEIAQLIVSTPWPGNDGFGHCDAGRVNARATPQNAIVGNTFSTVFEFVTAKGVEMQSIIKARLGSCTEWDNIIALMSRL